MAGVAAGAGSLDPKKLNEALQLDARGPIIADNLDDDKQRYRRRRPMSAIRGRPIDWRRRPERRELTNGKISRGSAAREDGYHG